MILVYILVNGQKRHFKYQKESMKWIKGNLLILNTKDVILQVRTLMQIKIKIKIKIFLTSNSGSNSDNPLITNNNNNDNYIKSNNNHS